MAKKTAQVDIKLTGVQSISQLEQELADINQQLKNVDINSQEFQTLSTQAQQATAKLEGVNTQLKGVTSVERSDAMKKMGEGMVGAFQVGAGASLLFGEQTSESLNKVIGKVAGLYSAVDGMDKLTKAFAKENISRLGFLGNAFKGVGTQAKAAGAATKVAGVTMKTALISTGIGALIVALGVLIAKWDDITAAIKRNREEKERAKNIEKLEAEIELNGKLLDAYESEAETQKRINDLNDESFKNRKIEIDTITKQQEELTKQIELANEEREKSNSILQRQEEIVEKQTKKQASQLSQIEAGNSASGLGLVISSKKLEKAKDLIKETEKELGLNKANADVMQKELELLEAQKAEMLDMSNLITEAFTPYYEGQIELIDTRIARLQKENELYAAQGNQGDRIYKNKLELNELGQERLDYEEKIAGEQTQQNITSEIQLEIQKKVNAQLNKNRIDALKTEIARLDAAKHYQQQLEVHSSMVGGITDNMNLQNILTADANEKLQQKLRLTELEAEKQDYITQAQIDSFPFDAKGLKILKERLGLRTDELKLVTELPGIIQLAGEKELELDKLSQRQLLTYYDEASTMKDIYDTKVEILNTEKDSYSNSIQIYENQAKYQRELGRTTETEIGRVEKIKEGLELELNKAKNLEEELEIKQKIAAADAEIVGFQNEANGYFVESDALFNDANELRLRQLEIDNDLAVLGEENLQRQQQIKYEIEEQTRLSAQLNEFVSQYSSEIAATQEVMNALFDFAAQRQQNIADAADERIAKAQANLVKLNAAQEKSGDKLTDLQDELADADGERYDELLRLIKEEQDAQALGSTAILEQIALEEEAEKQATNAKMKAEYEKAKLEKRQALINAAINTALGVIKALPNVFLAAAAAIAGGIGIATIASQKVAEPVYLADGGLLEGASHADGGIAIGNTGIEVEGQEFVVNKRSTAAYLPILEAINNKGKTMFADGGQLPAVQTDIQQEFIDYERLAREIGKLNIVVSVVDINAGQNKVKIVQNNASL